VDNLLLLKKQTGFEKIAAPHIDKVIFCSRVWPTDQLLATTSKQYHQGFSK
jgi:hypothetical protein